MRIIALLVAVLTLGSASVLVPVASAADMPARGGAVSASPAALVAARLDPEAALARINALRTERGLKALALDPALSSAAQRHAEDLATLQDAVHIGSDGGDPFDRVAAAGFDAVTVGENVSAGQRGQDEAIDGWIESPAHLATILAPSVTHFGVALAYDPTTRFRTYWTMVVAEPF